MSLCPYKNTKSDPLYHVIAIPHSHHADYQAESRHNAWRITSFRTIFSVRVCVISVSTCTVFFEKCQEKSEG